MKAALLLTIALVPVMLRAQAPACTRESATLQGAYIITATGTTGGPFFGNQVGPFAGVGTIVYDGSGSLQTSVTVSVFANVFRGVLRTGEYTVNSDCTGTMTWHTPNGDATWDIVVTADGRKVASIATNPGATITATALRLVHHDHDRD